MITTAKNFKTVLFVSLIVAMIMPFSATDMAFAESSTDVKINEYKQKALRDNEVPYDELLQRVDDK